MASGLRIEINPTFEEKLDVILERFFLEVEESNTYIPDSWTLTIFSLHEVVKKHRDLFSKETRNGVKYLMALMWNTVCRKCDVYVCKWLYDFSKAWLVRDDLPLFVDCTCSNSDEY